MTLSGTVAIDADMYSISVCILRENTTQLLLLSHRELRMRSQKSVIHAEKTDGL